MKTEILKKLKESKFSRLFAGTRTGKYFKTLLLLLVGLFLGWLIFGGSGSTGEQGGDEHNHQEEQKKGQIWTCSMHPQIREDGPGKCPICGMDLIPLDESGGSDNQAVLEMTPAAVSLANIMTAKVKSEIPEKKLYLNGKIEIDERNLHRQIAHFPGRIEQLYINFTGQKVRKGERIARIYSPELVTAQKELFEAKKLKNTMPGIYKAAREKLKLWKLTDKQINDIEKSGKIREELDVLADAGGYVLKRNVTTGSQVQLGDVLFEIADLSKVWVVFDVYEEDISWVKVGDLIDFTVSSIPSKKFTSRVKYIVPVLNSADRTVKVWTEYSNVNDLLKPGMFVRGLLKSRAMRKHNSIIIPKSAVLWTGKRSVVFIKLPDTETPQFEMREITLGGNLGDAYIVEEGISEGEEIVVNGVFKIDAAAQLSGKYSSMNKPQINKESETDKSSAADFRDKTPKQFKTQLTGLVNAYFNLKDALINADSKSASASAKLMADKLKNVDMGLLEHEAHLFWMEQMKMIKEYISKIAGESDIDKQRAVFIDLSDAMIRSVKALGTVKAVYVLHCPMANDNKGADWLSNEAKVLNPYFGDMMLECGDVKEKIK